jgi:diguanylate cyclase (GGDEF)-like protein
MAGSLWKSGIRWRTVIPGVASSLVLFAIDCLFTPRVNLGLIVPPFYLGVLVFVYRTGTSRGVLAAGVALALLTFAGALPNIPFNLSMLFDRLVYGVTLAIIGAVLASALAVQNHLRGLSTIDALTGALFEKAFTAQIEREAIRVRRYRSKLSIVAVAIDGMAETRRAKGDRAGDALLATLARVCMAMIRQPSLFGRIGDRLLIAMPETTETGAHTVAERLRTALSDAALLPAGVESFQATVCFGISWFSDRDADAEAVLRRAAEALADSQAKGPGTITARSDS